MTYHLANHQSASGKFNMNPSSACGFTLHLVIFSLTPGDNDHTMSSSAHVVVLVLAMYTLGSDKILNSGIPTK